MTTPSLFPNLRRAFQRDSLRLAWARSRRPLVWVVGLFLALQALLALGVPWLIQGPGLKAARQALHREVSLDRVRLNPFTLALTLRGLRIQDPAPSTQDFVTVQRIHLNASISSLFRWAPVLDAVHIESPHFTLVRTDAQHLNISDLITEFSSGPPTPAGTPPARFAVHDLRVQGGELHFDDRNQGTRHAIQHIEFSVPYVASFASDQDTAVKPLLSAQVHGGELRVGAETKPFKANRETTLHVSLEGLNLAAALKGLPALAPWQIQQGTLNTQWQLTLRALEAQDAENPQRLSILAKGQVQTQQFSFKSPHGDVLGWDRLAVGSDQLSLDLHPQGLRWKVDGAHVELDQLQAQDTQDAAKLLSLASLKLAGVAVDGTAQHLTLGELHWDGLAVQAHRRRDGRMNILNMIERLPQATAQSPTATPAAPSAEPARPAWRFDIGHLSLRNSQASWLDEASTPTVEGGVKGLQADVHGLSTKPDADIEFKLQTELAHGGTLALQGHALAGPRQVRSEVNLSKLNLAVAQPYISQILQLQLAKGLLDTQGQLVLDAPESGDLRVSYKGQAGIDELYTREPDTGDDFLRWKRLAATDIDVNIAPLALSGKDRIRIGSISLQELFAKVVINKAGRINLQDILRQGAPQAAASNATPPATPKARTDTPQIELGGIKIAGGRLNFSDQFIKPSYTANITDLRGTVSAIGPHSPPAQVALQGRIEGAAPLTIQGRINPVGASLFLDIVAKARGIDLPTLSPYATKYTGYPIVRGKLSVDVAYKIDNGKLDAQNSIFLDQLTFGERVDSPTATQLPVLFAVSLLKNSRGEIDLRLPVTGSLNDPEFSIGGVLMQVFGNLMTRAVTAPFSLLASLFSGSEGDLGTVEFTPGTAELTAESLPRLSKLQQALIDRPALKLDITVHIDPLNELGDIRRTRLMSRMQAERRKHSPASDTTADTPPNRWGEADYGQWLQRLYDSTSVPNKPRNVIGIAKKIPLADMESLLMSAINVSDDALRELAQERAAAVRNVLGDQVPTERLFTLAPIITAAPKNPDASASNSGAGKCHAACAAFALH